MSGSYVNAANAAEAVANASSRDPTRPHHNSVTSSSTFGSFTSTAGTVVQQRQQYKKRQHQHQHQRQHQHQQQRPRSVVSQRFSQVYDSADHGRPAFLHRAAVTPALWLLCQMVLVVLFALCCAFLINHPVDSRNPWIRLEFAQGQRQYNTTTNRPYGELVCSESIGESGHQHCEEMKQHFELLTTSHGTAIVIKKGTVYRINAAVTFHTISTAIFREVDVSVQINNKTWISCQESITGIYVHCTLFGMQYLAMGSVVTFSSNRNDLKIASYSAITYFDIEMRF